MFNELNDIRRCDAKVKYKGFAPDCVYVCNPRACFLLYSRKRACIVWHVLKQQKPMGILRLQLWIARLTTIVYSRCQVFCINPNNTCVNSQKSFNT